jgi:hypothetical protein
VCLYSFSFYNISLLFTYIYNHLVFFAFYYNYIIIGWQIFGRNLAENWLLSDGVANDSGPTTNTTTTFKNKTIGAVASLPDSKWCNNVVEDYYPDYFDWYFIIGVFNIPLNILCLMNVYIPVRDFLVSFTFIFVLFVVVDRILYWLCVLQYVRRRASFVCAGLLLFINNRRLFNTLTILLPAPTYLFSPKSCYNLSSVFVFVYYCTDTTMTRTGSIYCWTGWSINVGIFTIPMYK